jgi:hypothetical protein
MSLFNQLFDHDETPPAWARMMMQEIRTIKIIVRAMQEREMVMDHNIDDLLSDLADERTQTGSLIALNNSLRTQISAALASVSIPEDVAKKINQAFDAVEANKSDIMNSININTPAAAVNPDASGVPAPATAS